VQRDCHLASGDLCRESAPLSQGSRASLLADLPRDEMALLIELVVHLGMNCAEFLQRLQTSKALHRPFASPKRLMGILCAIVEPTADLVPLIPSSRYVSRSLPSILGLRQAHRVRLRARARRVVA
jgi:hypothetical protein